MLLTQACGGATMWARLVPPAELPAKIPLQGQSQAQAEPFPHACGFYHTRALLSSKWGKSYNQLKQTDMQFHRRHLKIIFMFACPSSSLSRF